MRGILAGFVTTLAGCAMSPEPGLRASLEAIAQEHPDRIVCVAYRDLERGGSVMLDADRVLHAASTMKVPVMIEAYRRARDGSFDLDTLHPVRATFRSIVDGSPYSLDAADDSEKGLYDRIGQSVSLRDLVRLMIVRSSNLATNLLVERLGATRIQETMRELGAVRMKVLRGVEDIKAYRKGLSNTATARDLMHLLGGIARGHAASEEDCREMLEVLLAQEFNELIPAGLPPRTRVAHKTGRVTGILHDAAIVLPKDHPPFVLVVLTKGFEDREKAAAVIARIASEVWKAHVDG